MLIFILSFMVILFDLLNIILITVYFFIQLILIFFISHLFMSITLIMYHLMLTFNINKYITYACFIRYDKY
jgi:hypothetical protein